ncbi:hypothetical protein [Tautonia plasticadhaerens]|uniref:AlgX/AlgJ SGNH hydrolase-like domain-containing protein n=1 Tax=Tautonia plasticadhaerens TaxID=2527974 RepID=A0A518GW95_9BACT|nr:hypothetical protein [Tautonia plasticadhaerens]QDV32854.1 hypothetical protein ElP_06940 [Tautonia plasticadhaerens]
MDSASRRSRLPLGLIGAAVLVALIEASLSDRPIEHATKPGLAWGFGATASASHPGAIGAEVLCLGDSLVKLGVQPPVLEGRLGLRSFNLAVPGAPAPASLLLLRKAIDAGARPKVVVVDFDENLLAVSPREGLEQWPELLDGRGWLDLTLLTGDLDLAARVGLGMALPSWRDRRAIREQVVAALNDRERAILPELRALRRNWLRNGGAQLAPPGDRVPSEWRPPGGDGGPPGRRWKSHPANEAAVHRLFELADHYGITVAWLLPPTRPDWQSRRDSLGIVDAVDRFVAEVRSGHRNLVVLDARASGFPAEVFRDPTHLDGLGAVALTESLAEALRPMLDPSAGSPPPGLVSLRPFEPPAGPISQEDMARSAAITAAEETRRR